MFSQTLNIRSLNVHACSTFEGKRELIPRMFDVLGLNNTKLKGKGECEFECVIERMPGMNRGRTREGMALLVSLTVRHCVLQLKEVSSLTI